MNIISTLRVLRRQIEELQKNQKEVEKPVILYSGVAYETDPLQNIDMITYAVEDMYNKLIKASFKIIDDEDY